MVTLPGHVPQFFTVIRAVIDIVLQVDYSCIPFLRFAREAEVGVSAGRPLAWTAGIHSHSDALLGHSITSAGAYSSTQYFDMLLVDISYRSFRRYADTS